MLGVLCIASFSYQRKITVTSTFCVKNLILFPTGYISVQKLALKSLGGVIIPEKSEIFSVYENFISLPMVCILVQTLLAKSRVGIYP